MYTDFAAGARFGINGLDLTGFYASRTGVFADPDLIVSPELIFLFNIQSLVLVLYALG